MSDALLQHLAISPMGFVFDPQSGATYTVNETGRLILESIRDGLSLDRLVDRLSGRFDIRDADVVRDVLEYVGLMREHGLLPRDYEVA